MFVLGSRTPRTYCHPPEGQKGQEEEKEEEEEAKG